MDRCILNGRFSQKQPLALATRYLWLPLRVVRQGGGNGCRLGTQSWYLSDHTFPMQFFRLWFCWLDSRHIYKWLGSWHPSGCVAKVRHLGVSLLGMNFLCVATTSERTWIMAWRFFLFQLKAICVLPRESSRTWDLLQGEARSCWRLRNSREGQSLPWKSRRSFVFWALASHLEVFNWGCNDHVGLLAWTRSFGSFCILSLEARVTPTIVCRGFVVVHTARRYYRLDGLVRSLDCEAIAAMWMPCEKLIKLGHLEEVKVVTRFP